MRSIIGMVLDRCQADQVQERTAAAARVDEVMYRRSRNGRITRADGVEVVVVRSGIR